MGRKGSGEVAQKRDFGTVIGDGCAAVSLAGGDIRRGRRGAERAVSPAYGDGGAAAGDHKPLLGGAVPGVGSGVEAGLARLLPGSMGGRRPFMRTGAGGADAGERHAASGCPGGTPSGVRPDGKNTRGHSHGYFFRREWEEPAGADFRWEGRCGRDVLFALLRRRGSGGSGCAFQAAEKIGEKRSLPGGETGRLAFCRVSVFRKRTFVCVERTAEAERRRVPGLPGAAVQPRGGRRTAAGRLLLWGWRERFGAVRRGRPALRGRRRRCGRPSPPWRAAGAAPPGRRR